MARTRDPLIEARVLRAAIAVYAAAGWSGFSYDAVAREAGVGKPALYLRWASREDLLFAAVDIEMPAHDLPDTGSIRVDLIGMADELLDGLIRGPGAAVMRLQMDVARYPELVRIHEKLVLSRRDLSRAMVLRAIERGELRPDTQITALLDLVAGAVGNHFRNALAAELPTLIAHRAGYVASVVDAALASFLTVRAATEAATAGWMEPQVGRAATG
jgi:AcrR family transcriptional regulator